LWYGNDAVITIVKVIYGPFAEPKFKMPRYGKLSLLLGGGEIGVESPD